MLNYEVDPEVLRPLVPAGVELDLWEGRTLVSVVGFLFLETRLLAIPVPFHRDFEEVNLRFYVRRREGGEWRRGVTFVREIVPRAAIAMTARLFYNEPYLALPMRHTASGGKYEYAWQHQGQWGVLRAATAGEPAPIRSGTEEEFIFEHYWGYTAQRDGGTIEYHVEHPRWQVLPVTSSSLECDVPAVFGEAFASALQAAPRSAFVAEGSAVQVGMPRRLGLGSAA
jgi:uncharacterized protein YqjF (DUF2071 family)